MMRQTVASVPTLTSMISHCVSLAAKELASLCAFAYGARSSDGARPAERHALVAQLDRAPDYESGGREFESSRARHFLDNIFR